jgi:hypothetical protein
MQPITVMKRRAGVSRAVLPVLALLLIAGCRDASVTEPGETSGKVPVTPTTPTGSGPLFISGGMSQQYQSVRVSRGGAPVIDADVRVNGVPIPHCCGDLYSGGLPEPVPAGGTLNLKVVAGGVTYEAQGEIIATPTITAPAAGSTFAWTDSVGLVWSAPTDPDRFEVCLNCWANSLDGAIYQVAGSVRDFKIAPGDLVDYGTGSVVVVTAFKSDFMKSANSPQATFSVLFVASSREALIKIKR